MADLSLSDSATAIGHRDVHSRHSIIGVPCLVILCLVLAAGAVAQARTLEVSASAGAEYSSIQAAVDAAASGDTVLVGPGRYVETIDIHGVDLYLMSSSGPSATLIDGGGDGPVIHCSSMSENSSIEGFTITGGVTLPPLVGGGIYLAFRASPLIRNNIVVGNQVFSTGGAASTERFEATRGKPLLCELIAGSGGGIFAYLECSPRVVENVIRDNVARGPGGGVVFYDHANGLLEGNLIYNNVGGRMGGGVVVDCAAVPIVEGNVIAWNEAPSGAGIFIDRIDTDPTIRRNTLFLNSSPVGSGGIECGEFCAPEISANLICVENGRGVVCDPESHPSVTCNLVWSPGLSEPADSYFGDDCFPSGMSYLDGGNDVREIFFCGPSVGDFRTCGKVGLGDCGPVGAAEEVCDSFNCKRTRTSWGSVKAIYRDP